jgi:hypothetical protein
MVVHGCIDGFSRLPVYLKCCDNNLSTTVLEIFKESVSVYGLPKRIRCDLGGENVKVAEFMLLKRGVNNKAVITGRSVHNQRIERLWRDVFKGCLSRFHSLFYKIESNVYSFKFDINNEFDVCCLKYFFLPIVNKCLDQWREAWLHHKLRTTKMTPIQMFNDSLKDVSDVMKLNKFYL